MAKGSTPGPSTRKVAGDIPDHGNENAGYRGGVARTMAEPAVSVEPFVSTMDRALGDMGRVNPHNAEEKPPKREVYRRQ